MKGVVVESGCESRIFARVMSEAAPALSLPVKLARSDGSTGHAVTRKRKFSCAVGRKSGGSKDKPKNGEDEGGDCQERKAKA